MSLGRKVTQRETVYHLPPSLLQPYSLNKAETMASAATSYYELYRGSRYSLATALLTTRKLTAVLPTASAYHLLTPSTT